MKKDMSYRRAFELLNLEYGDFSSLDRQYRKMAMKHHPDRGGDLDKMQEINLAKRFLDENKDSFKRSNGSNLKSKKKDIFKNKPTPQNKKREKYKQEDRRFSQFQKKYRKNERFLNEEMTGQESTDTRDPISEDKLREKFDEIHSELSLFVNKLKSKYGVSFFKRDSIKEELNYDDLFLTMTTFFQVEFKKISCEFFLYLNDNKLGVKVDEFNILTLEFINVIEKDVSLDDLKNDLKNIISTI